MDFCMPTVLHWKGWSHAALQVLAWLKGFAEERGLKWKEVRGRCLTRMLTEGQRCQMCCNGKE
jgi:hypothetical protein